jgi:hypothetical protein
MAAGYRSYAFRWLGGLSVPSSTGCVCPTYKRDGSLSNNWVSDSCGVSHPSLPYASPMFRLYMLAPIASSYKVPATLANAWQRKACD